jgi:hypothetical protein
VDASTPFVTSTFSNAFTFAFPTAAAGDKLGDGAGEGLGLAGAAAGSAAFDVLAVLAAGPFFVSESSFVPAKTGATDTATSSELQSHRFRFINCVVLLNREPFIELVNIDNSSRRGLGNILFGPLIAI